MKKKDFLICMRLKDSEFSIELSEKRKCFKCNEEVWVSPASMELIKSKKLEIVCVPCFEGMEGNKKINFTSRQLMELKNELSKRKGVGIAC